MVTRTMVALLVVGALIPGSVHSTDVVGFHTALPGGYAAVRWLAPANSIITGITFYSNDASVFPEVLLACDSGSDHPPVIGECVRSASEVAGAGGYVTVRFDSYVVPQTQYLWVKIAFPSEGVIIGEGPGGGPGIGLKASSDLAAARYFFGAEGSSSEFAAAFDISPNGASLQEASSLSVTADGFVESASGARARDGVLPVVADLRWMAILSGTRIQFRIRAQTHIRVNVFNVFGERVRQLAEGDVSPGYWSRTWDGRDDRGCRVANGVYIVSVGVPGTRLGGKLILIR
jgi:hypothetical protein